MERVNHRMKFVRELGRNPSPGVPLREISRGLFCPPFRTGVSPEFPFYVRHDPSPLLYTVLSLSLTIYPSLLTGFEQPKSQEAVRIQA